MLVQRTVWSRYVYQIGNVDLLCSYEVLGINKMSHPTDHRDSPLPQLPFKKEYNSSRNAIRETRVEDLFIPTGCRHSQK